MSPSTAPTPRATFRANALFFCFFLALYALDQLTKWYVVFHYKAPSFKIIGGKTYSIIDQTVVWENFFNIVRVHNTGVAFGIGNGTTWASYVFLALPFIALSVLLILFKRGVFKTFLLKILAALLFAGVLGNLTDRLTQGFFLDGAETLTWGQNIMSGYVVDFLDVIVPGTNYHWPAFNVADSCISVAALLLFILSWKNEKKKAKNLPSHASLRARHAPHEI